MSEHITLFRNAADLRAACAAIPRETIVTMGRPAMLAALRHKGDQMKDPSSGNAAKLRAFIALVSKGGWDAAIAVMLACGVPLNFFNRAVRGGGESFNFYGIEKAEVIARLMLSNSPLWDASRMQATIRGTILAILSGTGDKRQATAIFLDDYMSRPGKRYTSGGTQSSSSAHALAAMGLISVPEAGRYIINGDYARDVLMRLAGVLPPDAGDDDGSEGEGDATGDAGSVIEGECEEVSPMLALPSPDATGDATGDAGSVAGDTLSPDDLAALAGDGDVASLPFPDASEGDASPPMLALPSPDAPPAKGKGRGRKRNAS